MIIVALAAVAAMTPPAEPLAGKLRTAIWHDVERNGAIGNGNLVAYDWLNYWSDAATAPTLHLLDLRCSGKRTTQNCRFDLLREGGPISVRGQRIPDRISCTAKLRLAKGESDWEVPHLPPSPKGGHSRTTMTCAWTS